MAKLKSGLVKEYVKQKQIEQEQVELKKKHHIKQDESRIVVEKGSTIKYLVIGIGRVMQLMATLAILLLAVVGAASLSFPHIRTELFNLLFGI